MSFGKRLMFTFAIVIALLIALVFLFMQQATFGRHPATTRLARIEQSPNYRNGSFQNITPTAVMREGASYLNMMRDFWNKPADNTPPRPLPSVQTDLKTLTDDKPTIVWFGHSSYLIQSKGFTLLVDPVFSGHASPVSFFGKAFAGANGYGAADMPPIDVLILTHDHYDHLDYETIVKLAPTVGHVYTALGVGAHLERWGIDPGKITEFDWWQHQPVAAGVDLTATPARHFSGRSMVRGKTLWTSFVLNLHGYRLFLGGDSGYDDQFKKIGDIYGPFDLALLECGQYGKDWPSIHMLPEETVKAAQELGAKTLMPVHWAKFSLAYHPWNEPIRRLTKEAAMQNLPLTTPRIGEPVVMGGPYPNTVWWDF